MQLRAKNLIYWILLGFGIMIFTELATVAIITFSFLEKSDLSFSFFAPAYLKIASAMLPWLIVLIVFFGTLIGLKFNHYRNKY